MHISRGRRHSFMRKPCFTLCLFSQCFMVLCVLCFIALIASCLCVEHAYILMLVRMIFTLLCGHCSHFYMTILVYDEVAHMFHIMFTWSQFIWYIILVLLLLALPWGSNVFVQVFQVTSIYVPSSSQLLRFMIGGVIW